MWFVGAGRFDGAVGGVGLADNGHALDRVDQSGEAVSDYGVVVDD